MKAKIIDTYTDTTIILDEILEGYVGEKTHQSILINIGLTPAILEHLGVTPKELLDSIGVTPGQALEIFGETPEEILTNYFSDAVSENITIGPISFNRSLLREAQESPVPFSSGNHLEYDSDEWRIAVHSHPGPFFTLKNPFTRKGTRSGSIEVM